MAGPLAGYGTIIKGSATNSAYAAFTDENKVSFAPKRNMLDKTFFSQGDAAKHKFAGLADGQIQVEGLYDSGDTSQALLMTQFNNGGDFWFQALWNGVNGHQVQGIVSDFKIDSSVPDAVKFTATIEFNGIPTAV
jgi:hypothetical protein